MSRNGISLLEQGMEILSLLGKHRTSPSSGCDLSWAQPAELGMILGNVGAFCHIRDTKSCSRKGKSSPAADPAVHILFLGVSGDSLWTPSMVRRSCQGKTPGELPRRVGGGRKEKKAISSFLNQPKHRAMSLPEVM